MKMSMASPIPRIISRLGQPCCHWSVATNLLPTDHPSDHVGQSRDYYPVSTVHNHYFHKTKDQHCFLVPSKSSRSTAHHPVLIAELSLKQQISRRGKPLRTGRRRNSSVAACFFRTQSSNSLLHLSIPISISSIRFHQHDCPADPA